MLRVAASGALLFHLLAMSGSVLIGSPAGDAVRRLTRPYEHLLGVYQQWNMFAPNAPRATEWMEIRAHVSGAAETHELAAMAGRPSRAVKWTYSRRSKFERQLLGSGKRALRAGVAEWACRSAADLPGPASQVELWKVAMTTPQPAARADGQAWSESRTLLERWRCP